MIPFAKGHGLGNDYIVMEQAALPGPLSERAIVRVCDRNWGVGSDGILLLVPTTRADFGLRIFNPDGSEAEKSGNGLRIFAKYLWDRGHARGRSTFTVDTKGGVVECTCHARDGRVAFVTVEMGRATFRAPDIRRRILYVLGLLIVFRLLASVPIPGVDKEQLQAFVQGNALVGLLDLFSGGGLSNFSVVALGMNPYINASIIMQLMTGVVPSLQALSREGEFGRNKINQYTRYLTVPMAILQAYGVLALLS